MCKSRWLVFMGVLLSLSLVAAACGGDDDEPATSATEPAAETQPTVEDTADDMADDMADDDQPAVEEMADDTADDDAAAESADDGSTDEGPDESAEPADDMADDTADDMAMGQPDVNGDGRVIIGVLSAGDTTDGGYYQGLVDESMAFAEEMGEGWEVIVVDQVAAADARQQMENLLSQDIDIMALGGGDQLYPQLREVAAAEDWGGVGFVVTGAQDRNPDPIVRSLTDNNDDISFTAGVAAGLALLESGGDTAGIIGFDGSDPFQVAHAAMQAGVEHVVPDAEFLVSTVGPDPNDVAASSEAARQMIAQGVDAIYPFLGGGAQAVIQESNAEGVAVFATSLNRCDEEGIEVYASILFQPGAYFRIALQEWAAGEFEPGGVYEVQPGEVAVGAVLCDPAPESADALAAVYADIQSGAIDPEALRMAVQAR